MPSFRSRFAAFGTATMGFIALALAQSPPALAADPARVLLIAMPRAEAESVLSSRSAALGLGVYPESRDPLAFIREVGSGAPRGRRAGTELGGEPGRLGRALADAGLGAVVMDIGPSPLGRALAFALQTPRPIVARTPGVAGVALSTAQELERLLAGLPPSSTAIVMGVSERTPVLVGIIPVSSDPSASRSGWILTDGIARRPAIVTPYDVTATILRSAGVQRVPSSAFIGRPPSVEPPSAGSALEQIRRLEDRLVRDASHASPLAITAVVFAIVVILVSALLLKRGRRDLAVRAAQGSWFLAAGYPAAQFLPTGRLWVRIAALAAVFLIGIVIPTNNPPRMFARVALVAAAAFAVLIAVAPLRPGGEPGLSLWGNPLVSWRFFGLQNGQAAAIAGGVAVWGLLAGLRARWFAPIALVTAFVIGTPKVGANFVGVLTFVFGAALAFFALVRRRIEVWHLVVAGACGVVGFVLALISDAASPLSHGGRAAQRISESGLDTIWRFGRARLELNIELIRDMFAGPLLVAMLVAAIAMLLVWSVRRWSQPSRGVAAVWAGAAMALASLVLEDSGFYSGGIIALAAASAWILVSAREEHGPTAQPTGVLVRRRRMR